MHSGGSGCLSRFMIGCLLVVTNSWSYLLWAQKVSPLGCCPPTATLGSPTSSIVMLSPPTIFMSMQRYSGVCPVILSPPSPSPWELTPSGPTRKSERHPPWKHRSIPDFPPDGRSCDSDPRLYRHSTNDAARCQDLSTWTLSGGFVFQTST